MSENPLDWRKLGSTELRSLSDARLQCHHAAQIVSSAAVAYLAHARDDSHTNMGWRNELGALAGRVANPGKPLRAALRLSDLTLLFLDASDAAALECPLDGRTLDEGYEWLASTIESYIGPAPAKPLLRPAYDMPAHPVAGGARFSAASRAALEELGRWFSNAHALLEHLRARTPGASEVRCWPHHFDIATLIEIDKDAAVDTPRTIGVGLSPGDGSYDEPYFYVSPYPYPDDPGPIELAGGGEWHTAGWLGAVLTGPKLVAATSEQQQRRDANAFVESAVSACRRLLRETE